MTASDLLALHHGPGFVLPNAWDAGSARILEQLGFPALATTSAGIAWSLGVPDGGALDLDDVLPHVARIAAAVSVPVTADLEAGYDDPAATVRRAVDAGVVGGNLEDQVGGVLFPVAEAAERVAAARAAAPAGTFVLNARTDVFMSGSRSLEETVARATAYVEAGADCVFVLGVVEEDDVRRLVAEVPAPLNTVAGLAGTTSPRAFLGLGVKRVSLGGSLARAAYTALERAGQELAGSGTLGFLDGAASYADLQARFAD